jgi:hypothetical protein
MQIQQQETCYSGDVGMQSVFAPSFCTDHAPIGYVDMTDVEILVQSKMLSLCNVRRVYKLSGHGIGFICSDPSMITHKQRILNRTGDLSLWARPAYGLRFDPSGKFGDEVNREVAEVRNFLESSAGEHFHFEALIFGAHYPCGAADGMNLETVCRSVGAGAQHLQKVFPKLEIIATIFVNTGVTVSRHLPKQNMLLWFDIAID